MSSLTDQPTRNGQEPQPRDTAAEVHWTARKLSPIILIYVLLVFVSFMAVSLLVFHSTNAVKSLAMACFTAIVAMLHQVFAKTDYRATDSGLEARPHGKADPEAYKRLFLWQELDYVKPVTRGYKFFKILNERRPAMRFLKMSFSDRHSGEIHVETRDRARIHELLNERGITIRHR